MKINKCHVNFMGLMAQFLINHALWAEWGLKKNHEKKKDQLSHSSEAIHNIINNLYVCIYTVCMYCMSVGLVGCQHTNVSPKVKFSTLLFICSLIDAHIYHNLHNHLQTWKKFKRSDVLRFSSAQYRSVLHLGFLASSFKCRTHNLTSQWKLINIPQPLCVPKLVC